MHAKTENIINHFFSKIDGRLLKQQRKDLRNTIEMIGSMIVSPDHQKYKIRMVESLEGIASLLDYTADIAHDIYGIDTLFVEKNHG